MRAGHQPQDRQGPRPDDPGVALAAGGPGDRVMDRRAFLGTLAGSMLAAPLAAKAQQPGKVPRVGVLANGSAATSPAVDAFRQGLRDLGHVEGQNIMLEIQWAEGRFERMLEFAAELDRWKPDVL